MNVIIQCVLYNIMISRRFHIQYLIILFVDTHFARNDIQLNLWTYWIYINFMRLKNDNPRFIYLFLIFFNRFSRFKHSVFSRNTIWLLPRANKLNYKIILHVNTTSETGWILSRVYYYLFMIFYLQLLADVPSPLDII